MKNQSIWLLVAIIAGAFFVITVTAANNPEILAATGVFVSQERSPTITYVGCLNEQCSEVFYCWNAHYGIRNLDFCSTIKEVTSVEDAEQKILEQVSEAWDRLTTRNFIAEQFGYSSL